MLYKRSTYALYCLHEATAEDASERQKIYAFSVLTGRAEPLELRDLQHLHHLPANRWVDCQELGRLAPGSTHSGWHALAQAGLVLVQESGDSRLDELRGRHERLDADAWNGLAATYHFMGRWQDAHHRIDPSEEDRKLRDWGMLDARGAADFLTRHGQPPSHFHTLEKARSRHPMPLVKRQGGFWDTLSRRRTTRFYNPTKAISRDDLATILYHTFGCHGVAPMFDGIDGIKKTSPSGGGLHPIEIYPLVLNAEGLAPGLYHYNLAHHRLDLMESLEDSEARELAHELAAGQRYTQQAGVLFLMTARFFRNYWKYRRHDKAYGVLLMDAAHLSQTLYLVCAELGLGAFFTAAVNGRNIEQRLGLDGYQEGALAICGCGHAAAWESPMEPRFRSFEPTSEAPFSEQSPTDRLRSSS